jgi:hypothetical protein
MATQLGSSTQKARKRHRCDSCCGIIEVGETYHRSRMVDGGDAWVFKVHPHCRAAGDILWDNGIRNEDDFIVNVSDMDREDREMVYRKSPETYHAIWPDAPAPGTPQLATQ